MQKTYSLTTKKVSIIYAQSLPQPGPYLDEAGVPVQFIQRESAR